MNRFSEACLFEALESRRLLAFTLFDDQEVVLVATNPAGVIEPAVPVYFNGGRVDDPATPEPDEYTAIEFFQRVSGTSSFPRTMTEVVAAGHTRLLVQHEDGTSSPDGTSVIGLPSFRPQGQRLQLIPRVTRAEIDTTEVGVVRITLRGSYDGWASVVRTLTYEPAEVGRTTVRVEYALTVEQDLMLQDGAAGRGFDAFRLATLSSMFASGADGLYDANVVRLTTPDGHLEHVTLTDGLRDAHVWNEPPRLGVRARVALVKDGSAVWFPDSPSIEVEIESLSGPIGSVGAQGFLASSTDPNDDSLTT